MTDIAIDDNSRFRLKEAQMNRKKMRKIQKINPKIKIELYLNETKNVIITKI